jgi:tetratricopeptide (TPR) repeat protein
MPTELNLNFTDANHFIIRLGPDDEGSLPLGFNNPIAEKDLRDIQWYVETYGAHSLGDPDDDEAKRIAGQLPLWGKALFNAVFTKLEAQRRFNSFQNDEAGTRLLTISSERPAVLALPWELLHDPATGGGFLFMETPRISIRRRVGGATGGRVPHKLVAKETLHILFVVSRPTDEGFLDPRSDSLPVLDAIDEHASGRVTHEFLRPPTLDALVERLEDTSKPAVDIVHFDGHGVFDRQGNLPNRAAASQTTRLTKLEDILRAKKVEVPVDPACPPDMGYLLFETIDGHTDFVSAEKLGANLHRHKVALVILSACQSATVGGERMNPDGEAERPMGSVAARLTATGIPSVLAMTHSVLVHTTRALFGEFYKELARHKSIGEALDNARRYLANHPEKYEVQRGPDRVPLKLYDWFLPALYQAGSDGPLLTKAAAGSQIAEAPSTRTNLPKAPEGGFYGRKRSLWEIERWFAGPTHRITITGFGGQGKTALAQEAGRWLTRAGLFQAAVFVDYSRVQGADAVAVAKNEIGKVLDQTFIDAAAATAALKETPTLVILDNLEALAPDTLKALLDVAVLWSEAGGSRVLCTTRRPDFEHAAYRTEGTHEHRRIQLDGLGSKQQPDDALEWCAVLMKFPPPPTVPAPAREALINLFDRVKFHPLSIRVLAQQLKSRRMAEVGERLEQLLVNSQQAPGGRAGEDTPAGLIASLELSLDKLDTAAREVLPRLGVFQGGAFEDDLIAITGLGDTGERERLETILALLEAGKAAEIFQAMNQAVPNETELVKMVAALREELAQLPPAPADLWPGLRRQLEAAALIEREDIPGVSVPFIRFHPTLSSMLWAQLNSPERDELNTAHRKRYYELSGYLYDKDNRAPHQARAIAWLELPNLLHAVHAALDAHDPNAVAFAEFVTRFLTVFGLSHDAERLSTRAQAAAGDAGTRAWLLAQSNRGEQLFAAGHITEAEQVFDGILKQLEHTPTYDRAVTLARLGRCFSAAGRPVLAAQRAREALAVCDKLQQGNEVTSLRGSILTDLADALQEQGEYAEARQVYEDSLSAKREIGGDKRGEGVVLSQLGTLAMLEGKLEEAATRYRAALALFQQLHEPGSEAVLWHQLGIVSQNARQWDEAERHYRESARIEEDLGNLKGAAQTWNHLAIISENAGKPDAAEMWYRKSIDGLRDTPTSLAAGIQNLAHLLQGQPGRLAEARKLAEEALAIKQTLDPGAAQIWKTYGILADIATKEAQNTTDSLRQAELQAEAREHRRLGRQAQMNFAGTRHGLRSHLPVIAGAIMAVQDREHREPLEEVLSGMEERGWTKLVGAIRRILEDERDADTLCADLDSEDSMIIEAILAGLADPSTLADLFPFEPSDSA